MVRIAAIITALLVLAVPTAASALPLGLTDRTLTPEQIAGQGMTWTRIITSANAPLQDTADQIRVAHAAGLKVVLTLGGVGTDDRVPDFGRSIAYAKRLPRTEYLSIDNEPDLDGVAVCDYRRGWMMARKVFGRRLLFGEFSPHRPLTFTQAIVNRCGKLLKRLWISVHPYQRNDPLAPPAVDSPWREGGIGYLGFGKRWLKKNAGLSVRWVPTEFGYCTRMGDNPTGVTDQIADRFWPRALRRFGALKVPFAIIYVADGPSWRSSPFPSVYAPGGLVR